SCSRYFFLFRADFHLSGVHSFPTRRSSDLVRGVDGLPTWTRRAVDIHADFRIGDLNRVSLFHDGQNLDLGAGSLTAVLVTKGRQAHQAVCALFDGQRAVHIFTVDYKTRRLDTGFFGI